MRCLSSQKEHISFCLASARKKLFDISCGRLGLLLLHQWFLTWTVVVHAPMVENIQKREAAAGRGKGSPGEGGSYRFSGDGKLAAARKSWRTTVKRIQRPPRFDLFLQILQRCSKYLQRPLNCCHFFFFLC